MIGLFRSSQKNFKTTHMLYQPLKGSFALDKLIARHDMGVLNFEKNVSFGPYSFDYYSDDFKIGLQVDAQTDLEEEAYNMEGIKLFTIPSLGVRVLKISAWVGSASSALRCPTG